LKDERYSTKLKRNIYVYIWLIYTIYVKNMEVVA